MNSMKLYIYSLIARLLPESRGYAIKNALLRWAGAKIGTNVRIYSSAKILGTGALIIGDDVHVGPGVFLMPVAPAAITLGSHIDIGPQVTILTGSHEVDPSGEHIGGKGTTASVSIASGSWICARATILPGVSLLPKTLVAAGAVVTRTPEKVAAPILLAGIPAAIKKTF